MTKVNIKTDGNFTEPFNYKNSDFALRRFPFPFTKEEYDYALNVEPHDSRPSRNNLFAHPDLGETEHVFYNTFDIDEHYLTEMKDRARVLEQDPSRFQCLPHMDLHSWDVLEMGMQNLSTDYPELFELHRDGDKWRWINKPMEIDHKFTFLDKSTLPYHPLEYITRQMQGDFTVQDQRDGQLWLDAAMATGPADWSAKHDAGMSFKEIHGPVPKVNEMGMMSRAEQFLMRIKLGEPYRRVNWTLTCNPRLDTSPESYDKWGVDRSGVTGKNVGKKIHLRVECQFFLRLPRSNGLLFIIRTYIAPFGELCDANPAWTKRLLSVYTKIDTRISTYKGFEQYRPELLEWLTDKVKQQSAQNRFYSSERLGNSTGCCFSERLAIARKIVRFSKATQTQHT